MRSGGVWQGMVRLGRVGQGFLDSVMRGFKKRFLCGQVRMGKVRLGGLGSGRARSGSVCFGEVRQGLVWCGMAWCGLARFFLSTWRLYEKQFKGSE